MQPFSFDPSHAPPDMSAPVAQIRTHRMAIAGSSVFAEAPSAVSATPSTSGAAADEDDAAASAMVPCWLPSLRNGAAIALN
jgi:hypothetical protein